MLTYRWLEINSEKDQLILDFIRATINELNWMPLPAPHTYGATHRVYCAFDGDQVVGWHVIQFMTHAEPLFVSPAYRGTKAASELVEGVFDYLVTSNARGFMIVAESPVAERLAEQYGMKKLESPVYVWSGE